MRDLVQHFLSGKLSRRSVFDRLVTLGFTAAAAESLIRPMEAADAVLGQEGDGATRTAGTGGDVVVEQMKAAGAEFLFTNPGSFEVGFFDAFLDQPGMQLILGLHEGLVVSMADGYYRASRKPAFLNLHVIAGTAQAAGQMYNAAKDGSALIVTAGLNDNEMWSDEAVLAPSPGYDQKEINRQFTKISWEAREPRSLALMLRRAFKTATAAPGGPVYLAMAHHALEAKGVEADIYAGKRFLKRARPRPSKDGVERAARMLVEARNPTLVVGDEIWKSGAQDDLLRLSEMLGLPVTNNGQGHANFPTHHPHYGGRFRMNSGASDGPIDLVLMLGAEDFGGRVVPSGPEAPIAAKFVRLGMDAGNMGRNYPIDEPLVADAREGIRDLLAAVESLTTADRRKKLAQPRAARLAERFDERMRKARDAARANAGRTPIHPDELGAALARGIGERSILVGENLTANHDHVPMGHRENEVQWITASGFGLGWGVGASTGVKLASPNRDVICSIGDGALMYSSAGFWTQARYEVPVLTVVSNNRNYQTVRHAYHRYKGKMVDRNRYTGMYLGDPDIDFVKLAESQGVSGERVQHGGQLDGAFARGRKALRDGRPYLIDVDVARVGGGADSTWHQEFSAAKRARNA